MEALYLFIILLLALTIGFAILIGQASRLDTINNWAERRCDLDAIFAAFYYKADNDPRSAFEFQADNLKFCIGAMSEDYLNSLFGPMFQILQSQMNVTDIMMAAMKSLRTILNTVYQPFSSMINKFMNKFKQIGSLASRIFQHLYMSMKKAAATATASIFIAISLQTAFLNGIDLVINIIMVVLYIMIALAFIFFLPLIPVMVFVTMAVNGIEAGFPGRTGGMGEVFCFHRETSIIMLDSSIKSIYTVKVGDILLHNQVVEAVIELPSLQDLYSLDGVLVSGDHLVFSDSLEKMIPVKDHSNSEITSMQTDSVWSLITSNRQIPVKGFNGPIVFSDWEEQPDTLYDAELWEKAVRLMLNKTENTDKCIPPLHPPSLDKTIKVKHYNQGWIPLDTIKRGDWILGDGRWTQVLGTCQRGVKGGILKNGQKITDGVWIQYGSWAHLQDQSDKEYWEGMQLITDSGSFKILLNELFTDYLVRDFTEVGWSNLHRTYARVEELAAQKR